MMKPRELDRLSAEAIAEMEDRFDQLPPADQELLTLCILEGWTLAQIAEKWGVALAEVQRRYEQLRRKLPRIFGDLTD